MKQLELPLILRATYVHANEPSWATACPEANESATSGCQSHLPPRRGQVLSLYLRGQTRKEIAHGLGVSPHTVRNHIRLVYEEYGFSNRIEALRWALQQPLLAHELLTRRKDETAIHSDHRQRIEDREPISIESAIAEAIMYFQNKVTECSLEIA
jgi:DNA-binding CsgD family transcriptional regulator